LYVIGTSGARWCLVIRSGDDPPGRRPRRRLRRAARHVGRPGARQPRVRALRAKAASLTYNLEHDLALATFRQAVAADPQDAGAYRGLASSLWLSITFRRGNMTVDDYLGRPNKPNTNPLPNPPADAVSGFRDAIDKATAIARARIAKNPKDADAHYQLGAAIGLRASYSATVEGSVLNAFRAAREAYDEEETALKLQPQRKGRRPHRRDVPLHRRGAGAAAARGRLYGRLRRRQGKGIAQIEEAAAYGGDNQTEARFALILLFNREKRYDEALQQLATLRERYPRNRLVWLESGSTSLRAGRAAEAERFLTEGFARFAGDTRPRMFGEDALWRYKRGATFRSTRPRCGRRSRPAEVAGCRGAQVGPRAEPSRARQAGAEEREQGRGGRRTSGGDSAGRQR